VTGKGNFSPGPSKKRREWGIASRGRWALFFAGGLGQSHGRGKRQPVLFRRRTLGSGTCQKG